MSETNKVTLQQQPETEARSTLALCPTLRCVHLADGAHHNWFLLNEIEQHLPTADQPAIQIVDYYHACDHLKEVCDAAWGESTAASKSQFERPATTAPATSTQPPLAVPVTWTVPPTTTWTSPLAFWPRRPFFKKLKHTLKPKGESGFIGCLKATVPALIFFGDSFITSNPFNRLPETNLGRDEFATSPHHQRQGKVPSSN